MGDSLKWKSKLLSSSLPLEFDAAKILVKQGFSVTADFAYARSDSGVTKDFSVDLYATGYIPFTDPNEIWSSIELLVECKQRNPNTKWLFFPDPNRPDFSPVSLGRTIRGIDQFSYTFFPPNETVPFDKNLDFCYKGTEVDEANGNVYDSELKHGITQLQYALPRLLTENIIHRSYDHQEDSHPFFFCPILLTTANLFVAKRNLKTANVEKASSLSEIAKQVPYLVLYSDYGPEFEAHCHKECEPLKKIGTKERLTKVEAYRKANGEYEHQLPSIVTQALANAQKYDLHSYFTQFVVCAMSNFPSLVRSIKKVSIKASEERTTSKIKF